MLEGEVAAVEILLVDEEERSEGWVGVRASESEEEEGGWSGASKW